MSLINTVLNNLEQRRAEATGGRLPREVRPLPTNPGRRGPILAAAFGLILALPAGIWAWLELGPARPLPTVPAAQAQAVLYTALPPLVVPVPEPPVASPRTSLPEAGSGLPPAAGTNAGVTAVVVPSTPALKLSSDLSLRPATSTARAERPVSVTSPAPPNAAATALARGSAAAEKESAAAALPGTIDKQSADATPQETAERLYRSALVLLNQGRSDDGLTTLRAALREDPAHVPARQMLIKIYLDSRSWDAAQGVLSDGLGRVPQQSGWAMLLSRLLAERGDNPGALKVLETHEVAGRSSAAYQAAIGAVMQRLGRQGEAIGRFQQATQLEPGNGRWFLGLATAHEADGHTADAREAYQRAAAARNLPADLQAFAEAKLK